MGFDFMFRSLGDRKDLRALVDFLMKQSLGYPNYEDWVQRAEYEMDKGYKTAILALSEGQLVGDVIYQQHKTFPRIREVKNVRIHPGVRRRDFARFMLRQAEVEKWEEYDALLVDAPAGQEEVIHLLRSVGYVELGTKPLYDPNNNDVVMVRYFDQKSAGIVQRVQQGLFL